MPWAAKQHRPALVEYDERRRTSTERGYGWQWQKAREGHLREHPLCVRCERLGKVVIATDVDHVIPHRGNATLFWRRDLWQSMCHVCHSHKTAREIDVSLGKRVVVCGAPGSGKTYWVEHQRKPDDIVYDMDAIAQTMAQTGRGIRRSEAVLELMLSIRANVIQVCREYIDQTAYIIVTDEAEAKRIAALVRGKCIRMANRMATPVSE